MSSALYSTTEHVREVDAPRISRDQAFGALDGVALPWWSSPSFIVERIALTGHGSIGVDRWFVTIPELARAATLAIVRRVFEESYRGTPTTTQRLYHFAHDVSAALGRCVYETQEDEIDRSIRRARTQ